MFIIRMSVIRKLANEAADNGILAPEIAQGISRVKSVKSTGIRVGNRLSQRQAQALLSAPDIATARGLRDRAILSVSSASQKRAVDEEVRVIKSSRQVDFYAESQLRNKKSSLHCIRDNDSDPSGWRRHGANRGHWRSDRRCARV